MPPLDFKVQQFAAGAEGERDPVARLLTGAGRTGRQPISRPGSDDNGAPGLDAVELPRRTMQGHNTGDLAAFVLHQGRDSGFLERLNARGSHLFAPKIHHEDPGLPLLLYRRASG